MKTFKERWVDGKLVRGDESAAPPRMPTSSESFVQTMYGVTIHGDDEPPRGYHTAMVDNAPKTRKLPFERTDAVVVHDLAPGAR